jgi:hypothetical protein
MTFTRPEDITGLSAEDLAEQRAAADARRIEIANLPEAELTVEVLDEFDATIAFIAEADERTATLEAEEQALADRRAAVRASTQESAETPVEEPEGDDDGDTPEDVVIPDDASELIEEREPVTAAASTRRGAASKAARQAPKPEVEPVDEPTGPRVAITAGANIPDFNSGQSLDSFRELSTAFQRRSEGWARDLTRQEIEAKPRQILHLSSGATKANVGRINKAPAGTAEFQVDSRMATADQFDVVMAAANERNRFGKQGGLIAAGGWCAPSETIYGNFLSLETVSGILDIPEVTADRGGINFTKGPDYGSIASTFGFMQTEAEAELGTEKDCYEVACPPFTEIRLDAIGFCITAGILTEAAYPELIDRTLQIGAVAHAHKVNASVINRILTYVGAAVDHAEIGSTTADVLQAVEIQALRLRYTYAMAPGATIEAIFPVWAVAIFRADLSRRTGVDMLEVSQADVERWFAVRGVNAQWVYDWQPFTAANSGTWTSLPDLLDFVMYPAGAFVKLTTNVISLDAIYDSVNTKTNTFTAAFFEEGIAVANTGATGVRVQVNVASLLGNTGAANLPTV